MAPDIIERWKASAYTDISKHISFVYRSYHLPTLIVYELQLPTARMKEWRPATVVSSPQAVTCQHTVIHTTLAGIEPATFRLLV